MSAKSHSIQLNKKNIQKILPYPFKLIQYNLFSTKRHITALQNTYNESNVVPQ